MAEDGDGAAVAAAAAQPTAMMVEGDDSGDKAAAAAASSSSSRQEEESAPNSDAAEAARRRLSYDPGALNWNAKHTEVGWAAVGGGCRSGLGLHPLCCAGAGASCCHCALLPLCAALCSASQLLTPSSMANILPSRSSSAP